MKKGKDGVVLEGRNVEVIVKRKKGKKQRNVLRPILYAIIAIAIVYVLTAGATRTTVVNTTTTITQPSSVIVPYQITEEYEEQVPYGTCTNVNRPTSFNTTILPKTLGANNSIICNLNFTNTDTVNGTWTMESNLQTDYGTLHAPYVTATFAPNESRVLSWMFRYVDPRATVYSCQFDVVVPSITVKCIYPEPITYQTVKKTRTITQYKNVSQPTVLQITNQTTENITFNRFFGYEMPFNFGW